VVSNRFNRFYNITNKRLRLKKKEESKKENKKKVKKKRMKITKRKSLVLLTIAVATIFLIVAIGLVSNSVSNATTTSTSNDAKETKTETSTSIILSTSGYISDIEVDCLRNESEYGLFLNTSNYKIYYANSDSRHFIFANFSTSLDGASITVYNPQFTYSLSPFVVSTSFLTSKHINSVLEFSIVSILVENNFYLAINALIIHLEVVPSGTPSPAPFVVTPSEPETKEKITRVSWIQDFSDAVKKNPFLGVLVGGLTIGGGIGFICCILYYDNRFKEKPPLIVRTLKKDTINLGRFIREEDSDVLTGFRMFLFKKDEQKAGLREVHCKDAYSIVKSATQKRVNIFQVINLDYHHKIYKLPQHLQFKKRVPVSCKRNSLIGWGIRHFPTPKLAKYLNKKIRLSDEEIVITEIELLENRNSVKRVVPMVEVSYIQKIADKKRGEIDQIKEWKRIPYYEVFKLQQDKSVRNIETRNPEMELIDIQNREFAEEFQDTLESLRATHYYELREIETEYKKTNDQITSLLNTLNTNNLVSVREQAKRISAIQDKAIPDINEFAENYIGYLGLGYAPDESKNLAQNKTSFEKIRKEQEKAFEQNPSAKEKIEQDAQIKALNIIIEKLQKQGGNSVVSETLRNLEITEIDKTNGKKKQQLQIEDDYKE